MVRLLHGLLLGGSHERRSERRPSLSRLLTTLVVQPLVVQDLAGAAAHALAPGLSLGRGSSGCEVVVHGTTTITCAVVSVCVEVVLVAFGVGLATFDLVVPTQRQGVLFGLLQNNSN